MFTRINPDTQPVQLYPKVERELSTVKKKGWVKVNGAKLRDNKDLIPQTGFQESIQTCEADVILTGGSASAGKSFCILLEALRGIGKYGYSGLIIKRSSSK